MIKNTFDGLFLVLVLGAMIVGGVLVTRMVRVSEQGLRPTVGGGPPMAGTASPHQAIRSRDAASIYRGRMEATHRLFENDRLDDAGRSDL